MQYKCDYRAHTKASKLRNCEREPLRHITNENHLMKRFIAKLRLYRSYLCVCDSSVKLSYLEKLMHTKHLSHRVSVLISLPESLLDLSYHVSISVLILRSGTESLSILLHWKRNFPSNLALFHLLSEWTYYSTYF